MSEQTAEAPKKRGRPPNNPNLSTAPKLPASTAPDGYITRELYRARYGQDAYDAVPEDSWGIGGHPDAMDRREWARVRGKHGI